MERFELSYKIGFLLRLAFNCTHQLIFRQPEGASRCVTNLKQLNHCKDCPLIVMPCSQAHVANRPRSAGTFKKTIFVSTAPNQQQHHHSDSRPRCDVRVYPHQLTFDMMFKSIRPAAASQTDAIRHQHFPQPPPLMKSAGPTRTEPNGVPRPLKEPCWYQKMYNLSLS